MSIQAKDLRIGNEVFYQDDIFCTICQIDSINDTVGLSSISEMVDVVDLNPIPLTTDILLKLGTPKLVMDDSNGNYWLIDEFLYKEDELCMSKGLHWLQNYHYFKTGRELEINLQ